MQQLAQQQPYQRLLQEIGQTAGRSIRNNTATQYWDVVQPLPGQPPILYLLVDDVWRRLLNPSQTVHEEVQRAFTFGHRVLGFYDDQNPGFPQAIVVTK
ncbi:hypothetical protein ACIPJS_35265 [Streptomyces sp. NPDC086783]|uniref:hypothetical protein n=1 Tax=Streptomyces sp. NPDC086783 TaxID=3365758 RepID=UPI00380456BC